MTSAAGPWKERLREAHLKIETLGGINGIVPSSRARAQLAMFLWCVSDFLLRNDKSDSKHGELGGIVASLSCPVQRWFSPNPTTT
jgi:hypothetical protein